MKYLIYTFLTFLSLNSLANETISKNNYVGYQACTECHQEEVKQWLTSQHNQAMQHATQVTVLGDFNQATFDNYGLITTFYIKNANNKSQYWVKTDGPDGQLQDYEIKYTFGIYPLQQYLIEFPGGRLQALDIAWDSRTKKQGGQRWYHLHPDEKIESDDILHWTGQNLNWNYMCAFCHSTNLEKNYQSETDSYQTSWSEINVSCEACHGPASNHIQWAALNKNDKTTSTTIHDSPLFNNMGLSNILNERKNIQWIIDPISKQPQRSQSKDSQHEIETCARCHSRRSQIGHDSIDQPLMNSFRPARLTSGLYYSDGQIRDEVYVYGSFVQSKMHQAGVTCSDCHDPHSATLKLPGDLVCNQCHMPETYRTETHHFHKTDVTCLDCHMPTTTYMGVDDRHDHSFRIPRPDLSDKILSSKTDIPNACNKCHTVNTPQWADNRITEWTEKSSKKAQNTGLQQFAPALFAHQNQLAGAELLLYKLIMDKNQPVISRATALAELGSYPDQTSVKILQTQLNDPDPAIRLAALEALVTFDDKFKMALAFPKIYDDVRSVRIEAARILSTFPEEKIPQQARKQLNDAKQEYIDAQLFNAERPESQTNLGNYYFDLKQFKKSETAYRQALKLQSQYIPAYLGLAQLLSQTGRESESGAILKKGLSIIPDNPELHHALGLSYIRQKETALALIELQAAALNAKNNIRYQYVYAIALSSAGQIEEALQILKETLEQFPDNIQILIALTTTNRDAGKNQEALYYAKKLIVIMPDNQDLKQLIRDLSN
ncbi:MAG: ammonia-forming cytochrome c nitrite reductase subunit c552 [Gammaproteobacteria bacterium]|nr:ammonia-forming cytochrome c nitrite reductase subunit c552 [Gammaproteobacteria bacterium]